MKLESAPSHAELKLRPSAVVNPTRHCAVKYAKSLKSATSLQRLANKVCQQAQDSRRDIYTLIQANQAVSSIQAMCEHLQAFTSEDDDGCRCTPGNRS